MRFYENKRISMKQKDSHDDKRFDTEGHEKT